MLKKVDSYFEFKNSFTVRIRQIFQWETYLGVLEGGPSKWTNEGLIESAIAAAKNVLDMPQVYVVEPLMSLNDEHGYEVYKYPAFPVKTCVAHLEHYQPNHDMDKEISVLGIIWFQNDFAFPIQQDIRAKVLELEWSKVAMDVYR